MSATQFNIESVFRSAKGIAIIGWVTDHYKKVGTITVNDNNTKCTFDLATEGLFLRTERPDINNAFNISLSDGEKLGFALWLPFEPASEVVVYFDDACESAQTKKVVSIQKENKFLEECFSHSGEALREIAIEKIDDSLLFALQETSLKINPNKITTHTNDPHFGDRPINNAFNIESVFKCAKGVIIIGWVTDHYKKVGTITVDDSNKNCTFDLANDGIFLRTERPDINNAINISLSDGEKLGFVLWVPFDPTSEVVVYFDDARESAQAKKVASIQKENKFLEECFSHSGEALRKIAVEKIDFTLLFALQKTSLKTNPNTMTNHINDPHFGVFAIDSAFNLDNSGILIVGWNHFTTADPISIELHSTSEDFLTIQKTFANFRPDVVQNFQKEYSDISNNCGFIFFLNAEIKNTEEYGLRYKFEHGDIWIHLQLETQVSGSKLIKKVLESIPSPHHLMQSIYDIYDSGLGRVFEKIIAKHKLEPPTYSERQFGIAPAQPTVSVIVPLYGRYDFMRHQLAHFVSDKDFDDADLIYVVDDPSIQESALITAISYHALFQKPFRVIWYDCNLGFSGANNVGVRAAKAEHLMLMNSDVIPQTPGWLSTLMHAYKTLPNAGILGPLLQFADNSIQHAGMKATRDPYLPGFLLNTHPGKGWKYNLSEEPSEQQLMTAACILLSKEDFLAVGGFDEGYLIGDFEDSDLCMAIKRRGKKLWLVPEAKLWHLERQSQNIGTISGHRRLVTLYNGWRYHQKIIRGEIANPETEE